MGLTCSHQEVDGEGLEFQADPSLRGKAEVKKNEWRKASMGPFIN